jgi:hypothetical protein
MRTDAKDRRVEAKLDARQFDDRDVRDALDELDTAALYSLGLPEVVQVFQQPLGRHWRQGDGRPTLAFDEPAVMQAIGRCASHRSRHPDLPPEGWSGIHPQPCEWCDYPLAELLAGCEWAIWHSRYLLVEMLIWRQSADGPGRHITYERPGVAGSYTEPAWRDFWALEPGVRRAMIEAAMYPPVPALEPLW